MTPTAAAPTTATSISDSCGASAAASPSRAERCLRALPDLAGARVAEDRIADDDRRRAQVVRLLDVHGRRLLATARRWVGDDADDALQSACEIALRKAPAIADEDLVRWMHTVVRHEAGRVRTLRERSLGALPRSDPDADPLEALPASTYDPFDRAVALDRVARSREAASELKAHELVALTMKAGGYSYDEIAERNGWTYTKVNRCMAEGRKRFLEVVAESEDGRRCGELSGLLDRDPVELDEFSRRRVVRHLQACAPCRLRSRGAADAA